MAKIHLDPHTPPLKDFLQKVNTQWKKQAYLTAPTICTLFGPMPAPIPEIYREKREHSFPYPTLFIDGGIRHLTNFLNPPLKDSLGPCLTLGDGDSWPDQTSFPTHKLQLRFPTEKDISDLGLGLQILDLLALSPRELHCSGFLGGDRGHEWCGILEMASWLEQKTNSMAHFDGELTLCSPGQFSFDRQGPFSLMALQKSTASLQGEIQYPLAQNQSLIPMSSHGLSNRATGAWTWESDRVAFFFWRAS